MWLQGQGGKCGMETPEKGERAEDQNVIIDLVTSK